MTAAQKILARHAQKDIVKPGEFVDCQVDMVLANDITGPLAIEEFNKLGVSKVFDKDKIALIPDHFTPNKDISSARNSRIMRQFSLDQDLTHYYEEGRCGIEHVFLPEAGLVGPGDLVIGGDSHTCTYGALGAFSCGVGSTDIACAMATGKTWLKVPETIRVDLKGKIGRYAGGKDLILYVLSKLGVDGALYKVLEFGGSAVRNLSVEGKLTISNMAIELGAKTGYIEPDSRVEDYVKERKNDDYELIYSDKCCDYYHEYSFNVEGLEPMVALPHLPSNVKPVSEIRNTRIDQVVIGSCTNGRIEDLREAREILKGNRVSPRVRLIVIPGSQSVYKQALEEGIISDFVNSGAVVSAPTCGPCLGGHMGILAAGEKALSTTNRNFVGRMGDKDSEVFLSGPRVAAASAVTGIITHPREVCRNAA